MEKAKNVQTVTRVRLVASLEASDNARVSGEIEIDLSQELGGKPLDVLVRLADRLGAALAKVPAQDIERFLAPVIVPAPSQLDKTRNVPPPAPKLEAELEGSDGKAIKLGNEAVIGRSKMCDVTLPSAKVSRQHARVLSTGDAHVIEDLGSANHTFKNGVAISEPVKLVDGDEIIIGDVSFRYRLLGRPKTPRPARAINGNSALK